MEYKSLHYSLSMPLGKDQDNISLLLRKLADQIEADQLSDILDITFHTDMENGKDWPSFTIYYQKA